jgi:hypothetical protein
LSNDEVVEVLEKFGGSGDPFFEKSSEFLFRLGISGQFLTENGRADVDAFVTNIDAGTGDEFFDLRVTFATEGTHGEIVCACH